MIYKIVIPVHSLQNSINCATINNMKLKQLISFFLLINTVILINAQAGSDISGNFPPSSHSNSMEEAEAISLPLRRISLLSSGVGYFEHSGELNTNSASRIVLPFDINAVNDALMSLIINDPASPSPSVRYATANSLERSLQSLRVNLLWNQGIIEILNSLRGAEIEVHAPLSVTGRIMGVEYRRQPEYIQPSYISTSENAVLSLFTMQGIRLISMDDVVSLRFTDESINRDLMRSMDLIMAYRDSSRRDLSIYLDGSGRRNVSLSYVIPAPVWKATYRLDLGGNAPLLQGWVIVDNDSDNDWVNVELSLLTGRPVSFIQDLFSPYWLHRPTVPLSIAGYAESVLHESSYSFNNMYAEESAPPAMLRSMQMPAEVQMERDRGTSLGGGIIQGGTQTAAGDQFEFTLRNPVNLERRQSAMLPLLEGNIQAERSLIFSGSRAARGETINPLISVELTNTIGLSLPPGPITVYDGGTYAGDALIEFFPEEDRRFISYGEDLSVSGSMITGTARYITAVNISGGVMTITNRRSYESTYTIRNVSGINKRLIIEHPIIHGYDLVIPENYDETTSSLYRFIRNLNAGEILTFTVREEAPLYERIVLGQLRPESILSYSTNQEIPANIRAALARAVDLRRIVDAAEVAHRDLESQYSRLVAEQDRIRRNLEVTGNQSTQGQEYLHRMTSLDNEIDQINTRMRDALNEVNRARREYDDYLGQLNI